MPAPRLSIIIPTLDEEVNLGALLTNLSTLRSSHEIVVVDGGSTDGTRAVAMERGARVITAARGRGTQLRAGASASTAPMLAFLHADVRLAAPGIAALDRLVEADSRRAWAYRLRIDDPRARFRLVEWLANWRSTFLGLPYGDQGLVLPRAQYEAVGGFADVPIMEDVMIARALRAVGGIALLEAPILVSARRWQRNGVLRRSLRNLVLLARFLAGTSPARLVHDYSPAGDDGSRVGARGAGVDGEKPSAS
jgi:rSAM/selenodomain-associated transferase 2